MAKARVFRNPNTNKWIVLTPFKDSNGYYTTRFIKFENAVWFANSIMRTRTDIRSQSIA